MDEYLQANQKPAAHLESITPAFTYTDFHEIKGQEHVKRDGSPSSR